MSPAGADRSSTWEVGHRPGHPADHEIEDSFSAEKPRAVFVDLTAAYDTVWHSGLICKLL